MRWLSEKSKYLVKETINVVIETRKLPKYSKYELSIFTILKKYINSLSLATFLVMNSNVPSLISFSIMRYNVLVKDFMSTKHSAVQHLF
jgi:hypothetical protein